MAAPDSEYAATQTTWRMVPAGSSMVQLTAKVSTEVTAIAAKAGISRARTGTPRCRRGPVPIEPAAPRPPTMAVRAPGQMPRSPFWA